MCFCLVVTHFVLSHVLATSSSKTATSLPPSSSTARSHRITTFLLNPQQPSTTSPWPSQVFFSVSLYEAPPAWVVSGFWGFIPCMRKQCFLFFLSFFLNSNLLNANRPDEHLCHLRFVWLCRKEKERKRMERKMMERRRFHRLEQLKKGKERRI